VFGGSVGGALIASDTDITSHHQVRDVGARGGGRGCRGGRAHDVVVHGAMWAVLCFENMRHRLMPPMPMC
jgi:hypothetical protein